MSRIDRLKEQHPELNITIVDMLAAVDPTDTYKYTEFLIKVFKKSFTGNEKENIALTLGTDLVGDKYSKNLNEFEEHVKSNRIQKKDISQYTSFDEIEEQVKMAEEIVKQKELEKQIEKLFEDDEYLVLIPLTKESNQTYGSNTKWCTTMEHGGYWEKYSEIYKIIFVLNKQTGNKIAISKGINNDEGVKVWDQKDNEVSIFETNIPSNIYEVISKSLSIAETNEEIYNRKFPNKNIKYISTYDDFADYSRYTINIDSSSSSEYPSFNYVELLRKFMGNVELDADEYRYMMDKYGYMMDKYVRNIY
jgi:hypothetical protein